MKIIKKMLWDIYMLTCGLIGGFIGLLYFAILEGLRFIFKAFDTVKWWLFYFLLGIAVLGYFFNRFAICGFNSGHFFEFTSDDKRLMIELFIFFIFCYMTSCIELLFDWLEDGGTLKILKCIGNCIASVFKGLSSLVQKISGLNKADSLNTDNEKIKLEMEEKYD